MEKTLTKKERLKLKAKATAKKLKLELKKSINTAIAAAFGFLIALSWRDVITGYVSKIENLSPLKGGLISAIIITVISVIGILIVTKIFAVNE
ncbi:hypothetical protein KAT24_02750 [Candidatus Pacearchaeota archaeon]|nr:hypothetical protein [Candidatus Pacearchaeota archaeon]